MGRYSPTVVADYGAFNAGAPLHALAQALMSIRERKRRQQEEKDRKLREEREQQYRDREQRARLANQGIFRGPVPLAPRVQITEQVEGSPTLVPRPTGMDAERPGPRYRDLGDGLYQDFDLSPEGRAIAADLRREQREMQRGLELERLRQQGTRATTEAKAAEEAARRRRVYEMALGLGFSEAQARVFAESGNSDDLARTITAERDARLRARLERPATPRPDPAITAEDARRKALMGNIDGRLKAYDQTLEAALTTGEDPDPAIQGEMGRLRQRKDSLASVLGSPPGDDSAYRRIFQSGRPANPPTIGKADLTPAQADRIQQEINEVNALVEQARRQGEPEDEVLRLQRRALAAIYQKYGIPVR